MFFFIVNPAHKCVEGCFKNSTFIWCFVNFQKMNCCSDATDNAHPVAMILRSTIRSKYRKGRLVSCHFRITITSHDLHDVHR